MWFIIKIIMGYNKFNFWTYNENFNKIGFNSNINKFINMNKDLKYVHIARHSY